jgi:16S rRNA G966 N2-methylase RsmD
MTLQFNNIENNQTKSTYKFIDLFAGVGGIRL